MVRFSASSAARGSASLSKGLVGLMGGEIGFDSAVGRGSTVRVHDPLRAAAETLSVQSGTVKHDDASGPRRILVADDNESIRRSLRRFWKEQGTASWLSATARAP